jgi:hypothetical protein
MKSFIHHIESLSNEKIDYFITNSDLNIFHEDIENSVILSGSFNPVHDGHMKLLNYSSEKLKMNKYYEISLSNVDKDDIQIEELIKRIKKFNTDEKIIISKSSKFIHKSKIFPKSCFIVGYDTAIRILDPSYLSSGESLDDLFNALGKNSCTFLVAGRIDATGSIFENLELNNLDFKYKDYFKIISEKDFRVDVSSTDMRRHDI